MTPLGWQIVLRPRKGRPLLATAEDRRTFSRVVASLVAEFSIAAFNAVQDHGHVETFGTRAQAGRLQRKLKSRLRRALGRDLTFLNIPPEPIDTARHATNAIHYTFRQASHHAAAPDPLHDGSNLGDLLGFRVLATGTREHLRSALPQFDFRDLLRHLDGLELVEGTELGHLAAAAAASVGLDRLEGDRFRVAEARKAAVHVGTALGATTRQIAEALGITERAVRKLRTQEPDSRIVRAIKLQIGLRQQIGTRALRDSQPPPPPPPPPPRR